MKPSEWIDRTKAAKGWSDYRVAEEFQITRGGMSQIRTGDTKSLSESTCLKVAAVLDLDPALVLADQALERAKNEEARSAWASVIERIGGLGELATAETQSPAQGGASDWRKRTTPDRPQNGNLGHVLRAFFSTPPVAFA